MTLDDLYQRVYDAQEKRMGHFKEWPHYSFKGHTSCTQEVIEGWGSRLGDCRNELGMEYSQDELDMILACAIYLEFRDKGKAAAMLLKLSHQS